MRASTRFGYKGSRPNFEHDVKMQASGDSYCSAGGGAECRYGRELWKDPAKESEWREKGKCLREWKDFSRLEKQGIPKEELPDREQGLQ